MNKITKTVGQVLNVKFTRKTMTEYYDISFFYTGSDQQVIKYIITHHTSIVHAHHYHSSGRYLISIYYNIIPTDDSSIL